MSLGLNQVVFSASDFSSLAPLTSFPQMKFVILLSLILTSCVYKNTASPRIRIVDLKGKERPLVTRTPELNAQVLSGRAPLDVKPAQLQPQAGAVKYDQAPQAPTTPKTLLAEAPATIEPSVKSEKQEEIDISEEKSAVKKPKTKPSAHKPVATSGKKFFVQVGSFVNQVAADSLLQKMEKFHAGKVEVVEGDKVIYRVLLGPFADKPAAAKMVKKVAAAGHDAILTKR